MAIGNLSGLGKWLSASCMGNECSHWKMKYMKRRSHPKRLIFVQNRTQRQRSWTEHLDHNATMRTFNSKGLLVFSLDRHGHEQFLYHGHYFFIFLFTNFCFLTGDTIIPTEVSRFFFLPILVNNGAYNIWQYGPLNDGLRGGNWASGHGYS